MCRLTNRPTFARKQRSGTKSLRRAVTKSCHFVVLSVFALGLCCSALQADLFTYVDDNGNKHELEARFLGSGQQVTALELPDGRLHLLPDAAITDREEKPGPEPLNVDAVIERLTSEFGEETFRARAEAPYVIGLVLAAPLQEEAEPRVRDFLKQAARFMRNVGSVFEHFAKSLRVSIQPPRYPMVMLIFETDGPFNEYNEEATGGQGVSAANTAGFYSVMSNRLAVRMSECFTFETPLHEAIHQHVYNYQVVQRLAPVPVCFHEGIATGFEGNGDRITVSPSRISVRYAQRVQRVRQIDWRDIVTNDALFQTDFLAGEAYAHGWGLHWLLVTRYKKQYADYVRLLAEKKPLHIYEPEPRIRELEESIGKGIDELQAEFPKALQVGLRRQRFPRTPDTPPGSLVTQSGLAEVQLTAVAQGGVMQIAGQLRNLSSIRPMSFHVAVVTDAGTYSQWHLPNLDINKAALLKKQLATRRLPTGRGGPASSYQVFVRSALPDSEEALSWRNGELPVPSAGP